MAKNYDLIVLGTGNAGYQVAMNCKSAGWNVAVVNDGLYGGTCAVRGCIPKKVLAGSADVISLANNLSQLGIVDTPKSHWSALIKHKKTFTDSVPKSTKEALVDVGIDTYEGSPKFIDETTIEVGKSKITSKKFHIAVGAKPAKLNFPGAELLTTSDEFLEMPDLPKRIVFVGGGYVSFEFAHVAARFGAEATILHIDDKPLPMFDTEIIETLIGASVAGSIKVELNTLVQSVTKSDSGLIVESADGRKFEADIAIHGAGRPPAIADLNLDAAGVEHDLRRGIKVDEYLKTSNPNIYAAGDAADTGPPLSPVAGLHGAIVADNLLGKYKKQPAYNAIPSVIFTSPAVAKVGMLESEADAAGIKFEVHSTDTSKWFDSSRFGIEHSRSKVLVDKHKGIIIGAHMIGHNCEELINIFALMIDQKIKASELKRQIFSFPSSSDNARYMF